MKRIRKTALLMAVVMALGMIPGLACEKEYTQYHIKSSQPVPVYGPADSDARDEIVAYAKPGQVIFQWCDWKDEWPEIDVITYALGESDLIEGRIDPQYLEPNLESDLNHDTRASAADACVVGCEEFVTLRMEPSTSAGTPSMMLS